MPWWTESATIGVVRLVPGEEPVCNAAGRALGAQVLQALRERLVDREGRQVIELDGRVFEAHPESEGWTVVWSVATEGVLKRLASWPEYSPHPTLEFAASTGEVTYINDPGLSVLVQALAWMDSIELPPDTETSVELDGHGQVFRGTAHHLAELGAIRMYLHDDTERTQALRALEHQQAELERRVAERTAELAVEVEVRRTAELEARASSRAKSAFLASMSHELRTPLNAILGYTEILLDDTTEPETRADLVRVHTAGSHLLDLVSRVLDLARVESGQLPLECAPVEVRAHCVAVVETLRPLAAAADLSMTVECPEAVHLHTDETRLRQILVNLLGNAIKFTEEGSIRLVAEVDGDDVVLRVEDTGPGIPASELKRVFQPFEQGPSAHAAGYGLGLAISHRLAERLGGSLTVTSTVGVGTTFCLRLPANRPT